MDHSVCFFDKERQCTSLCVAYNAKKECSLLKSATQIASTLQEIARKLNVQAPKRL